MLLCTSHLASWAGSEMVVCELAQALVARGIAVDVLTHVHGQAQALLMRHMGARLFNDPAELDAWDYDMIYGHHQVPGLVLAEMAATPADGRTFPVIVMNHLSPYEPLEFPGPFIEERFADICLANSAETADRLARLTPALGACQLWPNPAPDAFARPAPQGPARLARLLSVSHHLPGEVRDALDVLEAQGITVERIGRQSQSHRMTAERLHGADAVVTIGKTVQYALCARVPVFCYDRFGGPGWLTRNNFTAAANANFSGRCRPDKLNPEALAAAVTGSFAAAAAFARSRSDADLAPYRLNAHLDRLLAHTSTLRADPDRNRQRHAQLADPDIRRLIEREQALFSVIRRERRARHRLENLVDNLRDKLKAA